MKFGYRFGTNLISSASESGLITKMSKAATIVGLTVIGAMSASMVRMKTALAANFGGVEFELQTYLDQIFPLLLPLLYTLFMFWMLKKNQKPTTLLLTTIVIGLVGVFIGVL